MKFSYSADDQRAWIAKNLPQVQEKVDEPVVAYTIFQRSSGFTRLATGKVSPLASVVMGASAKRKASGLPNSFLLVLTPERLHVFGYRHTRSGDIKVRGELAVWDRSDITATVEPKSLTMRLVIESPGEGERVECEATKAAPTDDFLAALGAQPAVA